MDNDDLPKVAYIPFNGKPMDWPTWRTQFSAMNIGTGIDELLTESYIRPDKLNESTRKKSQILYRNLIVSTRNAGIASNIVLRADYAATFDGIGAWQALCSKYERSTKSHRINDILRNFHSSTYGPATDPEIYFHELENLKARALHCGPQYDGVISDLLIRNKIMDELEQHYPYHVASFNAYIANQERQATLHNHEPEIDIFELIEPASREYSNRTERKTQREKHSLRAAAFTAQEMSNEAITCMWCGIKGHYAAQCRKKERDLKSISGKIPKNPHEGRNSYKTNPRWQTNMGTRNANPRPCVICKKHDHGTRECPRLSEKGDQQDASGNANASLALATTHRLNDTTGEENENEVTWIVDSGSIYHVTPCIKDLIEPSVCHININTITNVVQSTHIGDIDIIVTCQDGIKQKVTIWDVLCVPNTVFAYCLLNH